MDNSPNAMRVRLSDALFTTIRSAVETDPARQRRVIFYTSFGVVKGTVTADAFSESNRMADTRVENMSRVTIEPDVIELDSVSVEHYSNHLPTGTYTRLFVRVEEIRGFAVEGDRSIASDLFGN